MIPSESARLTPLRAVVVGVGNMGRHHARLLAAMSDIDLVGVVDANVETARRVARHCETEALEGLDAVRDCDIAVVATPTDTHRTVSGALLRRGLHVLVEKPLAGSAEDALAIVRDAVAFNRKLAVGHVERFNAAISAMLRLVADPRLMQFERLSPYTPRIRESVVFDLMVHDLDLACRFAGEMPCRIQASGVAVFSSLADVASAILDFPGGPVASITSSRITQDKVRRVAISEPDRLLVADSMRQDVLIKRETTVAFSDHEDAWYRQASMVEIPRLDVRAEPLRAELEDFIGAVREDRSPQVDGSWGLSIVELASRVEAVADLQRTAPEQ